MVEEEPGRGIVKPHGPDNANHLFILHKEGAGLTVLCTLTVLISTVLEVVHCPHSLVTDGAMRGCPWNLIPDHSPCFGHFK